MAACGRSTPKPHSDAELDSPGRQRPRRNRCSTTSQFKAQLDSALQTMTPMVRAVVYLKLREDMSHDEIASHLGITPRMVRRTLTTGYSQLREHIEFD